MLFIWSVPSNETAIDAEWWVLNTMKNIYKDIVSQKKLHMIQHILKHTTASQNICQLNYGCSPSDGALQWTLFISELEQQFSHRPATTSTQYYQSY